MSDGIPEFPDDYLRLFDVVIRAHGHNVTGSMLFRVDLVDRYHDGPDVPSLMGTSPIYDTVDEAMDWASRAIKRFQGAAEGS